MIGRLQVAGPLVLVLVVAPLAAVGADVPRFEQVRDSWRPSDVTVLDRHGVPVQTVRVDASSRRLAWVPLHGLSPALREAVVRSEDRRFWDHGGVDWAALARSGMATAVDGRVQGGSTLTMQLAGLLDAPLRRPAGGRSVGQKLGQITLARALEAAWTKPQILEAYLNLVPLRGEAVGLHAASRLLFDKHPSGLDGLEASVMAALLRAPNAAPADVQRRACTLRQAGGDPCDGLATLVERALAPGRAATAGSGVEPLAPHAARRLLAGRHDGTASVVSSLDAGVQRVALQALREQLVQLRGRGVQDGAVLVLENASGQVLAWVGSSGTGWSQAAEVDAVLARRQPGSTLKPFAYALAFEQRRLTPASRLGDEPLSMPTLTGDYRPRNHDRQFKGWVSARMALASSLNVPAVQVGRLVGFDALFERLDAFGLRIGQTAGYHGPSLVLGSAEVTLLDLTNAYRALANGGRWSAVTLRPGAARPSGRVVADERAVHLVTDILADNASRAPSFGLDSPLVTRGHAAVKTGTSKDLRDNWCIGYSDRYTVGVWVGNADGAAMHQVSGTAGAAPAWRTVMQHLHEDRPSRAPTPPRGVVMRVVGGDSADEPRRLEWFLAGTEPSSTTGLAAPTLSPAAARFGIHRPTAGAVFALDPDIPVDLQRIVFEGEPGEWRLNGRRLGAGATVAWKPWPGRHRLELVPATGGPAQSVRFEVRGARVRGAPALSPGR